MRRTSSLQRPASVSVRPRGSGRCTRGSERTPTSTGSRRANPSREDWDCSSSVRATRRATRLSVRSGEAWFIWERTHGGAERTTCRRPANGGFAPSRSGIRRNPSEAIRRDGRRSRSPPDFWAASGSGSTRASCSIFSWASSASTSTTTTSPVFRRTRRRRPSGAGRRPTRSPRNVRTGRGAVGWTGPSTVAASPRRASLRSRIVRHCRPGGPTSPPPDGRSGHAPSRVAVSNGTRHLPPRTAGGTTAKSGSSSPNPPKRHTTRWPPRWNRSSTSPPTKSASRPAEGNRETFARNTARTTSGGCGSAAETSSSKCGTTKASPAPSTRRFSRRCNLTRRARR